MELYTAKLTGNKRGIKTLSPKVLLINIDPHSALQRNHCWVDLTPELESMMPKGHQKPTKIKFQATLLEYSKRVTASQYTLTNITIIN